MFRQLLALQLPIPKDPPRNCDHIQRSIRQSKFFRISQPFHRDPLCLGDIAAMPQHHRLEDLIPVVHVDPAKKIHQHVMKSNLSLGIAVNVVERLHHLQRHNPQPSLFGHFTDNGFLERLTQFYRTARQRPLAGERRFPTTYQQHTVRLEHNRAHPSNR